MVLENLAPRDAWAIFENVFAKTHRASSMEDAIKQRIKQWLESNPNTAGLAIKEDRAGNLFVVKYPAPGFEQKPALMLQGHLDMVCETDKKDGFDFSTPLLLRVDGDWVSADGTTLGADNGIGVSVVLALLSREDLAACTGRVEVLLTVAEESGLEGASKLDPAGLGIEARHVLSVDSETLNEITISAAGGGNLEVSMECTPEQPVPGPAYLDIRVVKLQGGHSGVDIHRPRGNAIKMVARMLGAVVSSGIPFHLSSWTGGNAHNAIPRASSARIATAMDHVDALERVLLAERDAIQGYYKRKENVLEASLEIDVTKASLASLATTITVAPVACTTRMVTTVDGMHHGPIRFSPVVPGLVETSLNVATIDYHDGRFKILASARSNIEAELEATRRGVANACRDRGFTVSIDDAYPAWPPARGQFIEFLERAYHDTTGGKINVKGVHAGLECSWLVKRMPRVGDNIASVGPTILDAHSPGERASITSVKWFYKFLERVMTRFFLEFD